MLKSGQAPRSDCLYRQRFTQSNSTKARSVTLKNSSSRNMLWRTAEVHGAGTDLQPRKRTSSFVCTASANMQNGTSESTTHTPKNTKARYKFPCGDFKNVHRCGVLAAQSRAGQYKDYEIEPAAAQLTAMIDPTMEAHA